MKYLLLLLIFCGCYSERKAKNQFAKASIAYPKIPAEYCANEFPVTGNNKPDTINTIDSSKYKEAIKVLQGAQDWYNKMNDSLAKLIDDVEKQIPGIDTICNKYAMAIAILRKQNSDLVYQLQHFEPIINTVTIRDTIPDKAALKVCEIDKSILTDLLKGQTEQTDRYKKQAKRRGLIMWSLLALIAAVIGLNIYLRNKKILN